MARAQLAAMGVTRREIGRRLASGHLHRVHQGVYAVGHRRLGVGGRRWAAVLCGGPGACLTHRAAAAIWDLRADSGRLIDVTSPRRLRSRDGVRLHRGRLDPPDVAEKDGFPVTSVARTLLDLAEVLPVALVRRAVERADLLDLLDMAAIEDVRLRLCNRRGIPRLRRALELYDPRHRHTRSELELRALALIDAHGLPRPEINARVGRFVVDLLWRDARVVVELDGYEHHGRTRAAFERDRRRDRALALAGITCVRLTWRSVVLDGPASARDLARLLARGTSEHLAP